MRCVGSGKDPAAQLDTSAEMWEIRVHSQYEVLLKASNTVYVGRSTVGVPSDSGLLACSLPIKALLKWRG